MMVRRVFFLVYCTRIQVQLLSFAGVIFSIEEIGL
jgi:hypothetical protein